MCSERVVHLHTKLRECKSMDTEIDTKLGEVKEWLKKEFAAIRTGQASPALLDGVKIESYGTLVTMNQVASIGVEDARTLRISPWDASQIVAIERALTEADLGVSVVTDSAGVRAIFPELTAERRVQLLKLAKAKLEDARISVRSVRDEAMKHIEKDEKAGEISEDDKFSQKETVQESIDKANTELEQLFTKKEQELNK
jgi:ribosome recycling factor